MMRANDDGQRWETVSKSLKKPAQINRSHPVCTLSKPFGKCMFIFGDKVQWQSMCQAFVWYWVLYPYGLSVPSPALNNDVETYLFKIALGLWLLWFPSSSYNLIILCLPHGLLSQFLVCFFCVSLANVPASGSFPKFNLFWKWEKEYCTKYPGRR